MLLLPDKDAGIESFKILIARDMIICCTLHMMFSVK